jgi:hypothetical protein
MPESTDGPYVSIACICQSPLQEVGGQLSIIRIMDRIQVAGMTPDMQPQPLQGLFVVVVLRSGSLRETYKLKIEGRSPQGAIITTNETPLLFEGEDRGAALIAPLALVVTETGLYWFEVSLEGTPLTRIPLRVQYQRIQGFPFPGSPPSQGN